MPAAAADDDLERPTYKDATVHELFRATSGWQPGTKSTPGALSLASEYLRLFTTEAIRRAAVIAQEDDEALTRGVLETKHLVHVATQLALDF